MHYFLNHKTLDYNMTCLNGKKYQQLTCSFKNPIELTMWAMTDIDIKEFDTNSEMSLGLC